ncbi:MAG: hypothetical protein UR63_C0044G0002 [Candidatus Roizmanbacteria bacterium GW2011_GWC2_35_12]|uniref:Uncharacterized protein n=1 Tax=Candidatus Roizmanbacteria bacterium GW2011_GWC2_35_12 TaxID=1618485 RepID=A0A0G0BQ58_9BACT|nr:MAG: hypothetical protein UR63_C0044G0002 [Candidatus Roizmanbacteria bacterium GW2011_GWC2_35_12]
MLRKKPPPPRLKRNWPPRLTPLTSPPSTTSRPRPPRRSSRRPPRPSPPCPPRRSSRRPPPWSPRPWSRPRLKYDETGCDPQNLVACRINGQTEFPAIFVRRIQSGVLSLTQGIVAIQQLAAAAGVPTSDAWTTLTADPVYATFVWCPAGNCSYPPDTAFPLMGISGLANVQFSLAIVSAHSPSTPPASINTVTCPNGDCWSAPLQ